jgi:hypothetical protein
MKTIVKIIICATLAALPSIGFAQLGYSGPTDLDVNGIFIGGTYTKAQVTTKWGTPTQYRSSMSENGLNETYHYSNNLFRFSENGVFHSFRLRTSNFVVYKSKSGGFKVGDPVSRIKAIGLGEPLLQPDGSYRIQGGDDLFTVGHQNGIITWISFLSLV